MSFWKKEDFDFSILFSLPAVREATRSAQLLSLFLLSDIFILARRSTNSDVYLSLSFFETKIYAGFV